MTARRTVLTGITTTGTPHLGNYVGAIRPAVAASRDPAVDAFFFMADLHALIKCDDPERLARSRLEIAATWLACGLDPERVTFYRQSDIPEIPALAWLLTCVTAKGLMNRAHAYKAAVDANLAERQDPDAGVTMGLYSYPILMAADILMFKAHQVPVGRDQVQHIEMARDIAQRFNHLFCPEAPLLALPEAVVDEGVATLPGLDGRKMSKSYDNIVPLFAGGAKALREAVMRIVTDSRAPGEAKDPDGTALLAIFRAFAGAAEADAYADDLRGGLGWGEAKQRLVERLEQDIAPMRERYDALMARPADIEDVLRAGAAKARAVAEPLLHAMREAVGLRAWTPAKPPAAATVRLASPVFKQYRADDGFHFKLEDGHGKLLLHGGPYGSPREAGQRIARLKTAPTLAEADLELLAEGASAAEVARALAMLAAAEAGKARR
jgi:tryptophanyl-tRNA synthetase